MVFSSITFLFYFLPLFLLCYWLLPWRNSVLMVASLFFYTWGEAKNLPLLLVCIFANYGFGLWIGRAQERGGRVGIPFALAITFNLAALGYYKYAHFALRSASELWSALTGHAVPMPDSVVQSSLPLGISFFTFHAISYLVDVYRRKTPAEKSLTALFTYIVMFPQLVAGPIVRFSAVARQLHHRRFSWARSELGMRFFVLGLAQKVLLANTLALCADKVFALPFDLLSTPLAWLGIVSYSLQIYFDFAGYSLMAIGLGLACGFAFPRNFNLPYIAQSMTEFWRRWHMSLSRWFRDYVYIPLGGNRGAAWRTGFNLFAVFFLCGLWHGANWTFVVWGMVHGTFLVLERVGLSRLLTRCPAFVRHAYTLLVVMGAWVLFRSDSWSQALQFGRALIGVPATGVRTEVLFDLQPLASFLTPSLLLSLVCALLLATSLWSKLWLGLSERVLSQRVQRGVESGALLSLLLLSAMSLASGVYNPFIYFRF